MCRCGGEVSYLFVGGEGWEKRAYGMSEGVTGSEGGGGRLMRVGVDIIACSTR